MITFTEEKKQEVLAIAKMHQEADRFVQGKWLQEEKQGDYFKGCYFGCMTQTSNNTLEEAVKQLNIPHWIVYVGEWIFEGLPAEEAKLFPVQLLESIPANVDTNQSWKDWHYNLLMNHEHGQITFTEVGSDQHTAIIQVAELFKMDVINESAWSAAWPAVESASRSARSARSAARSARSAARSARSAAWSAADSAAESADSAAESAHYQWMRDELIRILSL